MAVACIAQDLEKEYPAIEVTVDGVKETMYLQYPQWTKMSVEGGNTIYDHTGRMFLSRSPTIDTTKYFMPKLLGGSIEYDVDLSQVGCGCITAFYAVVMPAAANEEDPF